MSADEETTCPLTNEHFEPLGDFNLPATPGTAFGKLKKSGIPSDLLPEAGPEKEYPDRHIICNPEDRTVSATIAGMVVASGKGVRIEPLWKVSDDRLTMTMDFYPKDCFGRAISDDTYRDSLPEGCKGVDNDILDQAAAEAREKGTPVKGIAMARGQEAFDGKDGYVKLKFRTGGGVGTIQENGSMDFRERGGTLCVAAGDEVASLVPPTTGQPGFDVLGNELPAQNGQPVTLRTGAGITASGGDGTQLLTASSPGMVVHREGIISISDVLEVNSDVDLSSGNVHTEKGSISIKGTVTTGTEVTAGENVAVDVVVENATIKAGADIMVGGGILMEEGGFIEAGGNVTAKFMRNATVRAGGDVIVEVDFVNCDIIAGGRIIAEGDKGVVNGGHYTCGGMNVAEVGTDVGTTTSVTLTLPDGDTDHDEKIIRIKDRIEELEKYIGTEACKTTLLMAPKEDRAILAELFRLKALLLKKTVRLEEEKAKHLKARGKELSRIKLKARRTAHAGTAINVGGRSITLHKAEQASTFHWDAEQGGIAITGL